MTDFFNYLKLEEAVSLYELKSIDDLLRMAINGEIFLYVYRKVFVKLETEVVRQLYVNKVYSFNLPMVVYQDLNHPEGFQIIKPPSGPFTLDNVVVNKAELEKSLPGEFIPTELEIALKVWAKVFSKGLTPQSPPKNQHDMVRAELGQYELEDGALERIRFVVVADKSISKVVEPTFPAHTENEQGHLHHAPLLEIADKLWKGCKALAPYKEEAGKWLGLFYKDLRTNQTESILKLTNPFPGGGRPKKGV